MKKFELTNLRQIIKLIENNKEEIKLNELLNRKMKVMKITNYSLAKKISDQSEDEEKPIEIDPKTIEHYRTTGLKKRTKKNEIHLKAIAKALDITYDELLSTTYYESSPDHSLKNYEADDFPDDAHYWMLCMGRIKAKIRGLSTEKATLLCTSYNELLSIPADAIDISEKYLLLDEENQAQFLTYLGVLLLGEPNFMVFTKYDVIFDKLQRISDVPSDGIMESWDLSQLVDSTFPNKENTEEAETFSMYLLLLNKDLREIAKCYLSLDSDIKREMIFRIADQMLTVQYEAIE